MPAHTLAFPPLCVDARRFDAALATRLLLREVRFFLSVHAHRASVRLLCVAEDSEVRAALEAARASEPELSDDGRFAIIGGTVGAAAALRTAGVEAAVVASIADHKLSARARPAPTGVYMLPSRRSRSLRAWHMRRTPRPAARTRCRCPKARRSREAQGIRLVVHVCPPNVEDADRPHCLHGDYEQGREQLAKTYDALFRTFVDFLEGRQPSAYTASERGR